MADNPQKRAIANKALTILVAGRTSNAGMLFDSIDDTEFADYTTVSEASNKDKRLVCFLYEDVLKQVIEDVDPEFASKFEDLGREVKIDQEFGGWDYLFELPDDYLHLRAQVAEGNPEKTFPQDTMLFHGYSHVVSGSDGQAYQCQTNHTSVDDANDGQPPGNDGNSNWTLYDTDGSLGATWYESVAYKTNRTAWLMASNHFSNEDGDGAYIRYSRYVQAGVSDMPQYYPSVFKNCFAARLAAEMAQDSKDYERRLRLLDEYENHHKIECWSVQYGNKHVDRPKTVLERRRGGRGRSLYDRRLGQWT